MIKYQYVIKTEAGYYLEAGAASLLTRYLDRARLFPTIGQARQAIDGFENDGVKYQAVAVETELIITEV